MNELDFDKYKDIELKGLEDLKLQQLCVASNILKDKEIERLNNIINKAKEYITTQKTIFEGYDIVIENQLKNLLEILKGSDKNE